MAMQSVPPFQHNISDVAYLLLDENAQSWTTTPSVDMVKILQLLIYCDSIEEVRNALFKDRRNIRFQVIVNNSHYKTMVNGADASKNTLGNGCCFIQMLYGLHLMDSTYGKEKKYPLPIAFQDSVVVKKKILQLTNFELESDEGITKPFFLSMDFHVEKAMDRFRLFFKENIIDEMRECMRQDPGESYCEDDLNKALKMFYWFEQRKYRKNFMYEDVSREDHGWFGQRALAYCMKKLPIS